MLNLFRKKTATAQQALPVPAAKSQPDMFYPMKLIGRSIERFMDHSTFVGAVDAAPGFRAQVMPNGTQVAANREKRAGLIMDTRTVGICIENISAVELATISAWTYFKNYQKQEPAWKLLDSAGASQKLAAKIPFGRLYVLYMTCDSGPTDTQFDGTTASGATLMIEVHANGQTISTSPSARLS